MVGPNRMLVGFTRGLFLPDPSRGSHWSFSLRVQWYDVSVPKSYAWEKTGREDGCVVSRREHSKDHPKDPFRRRDECNMSGSSTHTHLDRTILSLFSRIVTGSYIIVGGTLKVDFVVVTNSSRNIMDIFK